MKKINYIKLATCFGTFAAMFGAAPSFGNTVSFTNTFTINSSHTISALLGLGASASYSDKGSATLPLFNQNLGALNSATIQVTTVNPTFTGALSCGILGLNVAFTQTQGLNYTLDNLGSGDAGTVVGPLGISLKIGASPTTISTTAATLASTVCYTNGAQVSRFCTNSDGGVFSVKGELDSYYNLGLVSALSSLAGTGSYQMQAVVTYNYGTTISAMPMPSTGSGGDVMLSYPTNAVNLEFQVTSLLNPGIWETMTNGITISNGNYVLMVPTIQPQQFFRLHTKATP